MNRTKTILSVALFALIVSACTSSVDTAEATYEYPSNVSENSERQNIDVEQARENIVAAANRSDADTRINLRSEEFSFGCDSLGLPVAAEMRNDGTFTIETTTPNGQFAVCLKDSNTPYGLFYNDSVMIRIENN